MLFGKGSEVLATKLIPSRIYSVNWLLVERVVSWDVVAMSTPQSAGNLRVDASLDIRPNEIEEQLMTGIDPALLQEQIILGFLE